MAPDPRASRIWYGPSRVPGVSSMTPVSTALYAAGPHATGSRTPASRSHWVTVVAGDRVSAGRHWRSALGLSVFPQEPLLHQEGVRRNPRVPHALVDRASGIGRMEDGRCLPVGAGRILQRPPHCRVAKPSTLMTRIG